MTNETNDLAASTATAPTDEQAVEAAGTQPDNCHGERHGMPSWFTPEAIGGHARKALESMLAMDVGDSVGLIYRKPDGKAKALMLIARGEAAEALADAHDALGDPESDETWEDDWDPEDSPDPKKRP